MRSQFVLSAVVLALTSQAQALPIPATHADGAGATNTTPARSSTPTIATQMAASGGTIVPFVSAGVLPDTPAARVDPNLPTSPFSGVVSLNIRYTDAAHPSPTDPARPSFICSGAMVSATQVLSAAHCVDTDGKGHIVDLTKPGTDIRVIFNQPGGAFTLATATNVVMHPDYQGFNICPDATVGCLNDDVAIITLRASDVPSFAKIYTIATNLQAVGTVFTQVGYGVTGTGDGGYISSPSFFIKRTGKNVFDLFDTDDEANFSTGSAEEVWYADFDSSVASDPPEKRDRFCTRGFRCGTTLGNAIEDNIGGGDSGGPSFVQDALGNYLLAGNNTFGVNFDGGRFGDVFGGLLFSGYVGFLGANLIGAALVPEPETLALFGLGIVGLGLARRRRRTR